MSNDVIEQFALRHKATQQLLRFHVVSNEGAPASSGTCKMFGLDRGDNVYVATHKDEVDYVRRHGDWWFNGVRHTFKPDELEVVKINITVLEVVEV
jgi:hypothetical protein